jgi:osmotically-inducible protein OsmY
MKNDARLKQDVEAELAWDPVIISPHIVVSAQDGVVMLEGTVASLAEKAAAERAAQRVSGVRALAVELTVALPDETRRTDADIAAAARHALDWSTLVPLEQVQATVERGHVTLNGEVEWDFQRVAARRAVRDLKGVISVSNHIRLASPIDAPGVERKISEALARYARGESAPVTVRIDGTTVRLAGHVHSWGERDAAAQAARSAPGVSEVINDIVVSF